MNPFTWTGWMQPKKQSEDSMFFTVFGGNWSLDSEGKAIVRTEEEMN